MAIYSACYSISCRQTSTVSSLINFSVLWVSMAMVTSLVTSLFWMSASCISAASYYDQSTGTIIHQRDLVSRYLEQIHDQVLVVAITGPYQNGKSSFISYFTGDRSIAIGGGTEPETKGVWLFGPYSLNLLKRRWGVEESADDTAKVIFIDTEGFQANDVGNCHEENKLLMCQMIAPYLALSNVAVLLHPPNTELGSVDTFKYFLGITQDICASVNSGEFGGNNMTIVDLTCNVARYRTSEVDETGRPVLLYYIGTADSFEKTSEYLRSSQTQKLTAANQNEPFRLQINHFWPLPTFVSDKDIFGQEKKFNDGFKLVSQKLLELLDRAKRSHCVSGDGLFATFKELLTSVDNEKIAEQAKLARANGELTSAERILNPQIDAIIDSAKCDIEMKFRELNTILDQDAHRASSSQLSIDDIVAKSIEAMDQCRGLGQNMRESGRWKSRKAKTESDIRGFGDTHLSHYLQRLGEVHDRFVRTKLASWLAEQEASAIAEVFARCSNKYKVPSTKDITDRMQADLKAELLQIQREYGVSDDLIEACKAHVEEKAIVPIAIRLGNQATVLIKENTKRRIEMILEILRPAGEALAKVAETAGPEIVSHLIKKL